MCTQQLTDGIYRLQFNYDLTSHCMPAAALVTDAADSARVYCSSQATSAMLSLLLCCASVIRANVVRVSASTRSVNVDAGIRHANASAPAECPVPTSIIQSAKPFP